MYEPLQIDDTAEALPGPGRRWSRQWWSYQSRTLRKRLHTAVNRYVPLLLYFEVPRGRRSVEAQLKARAEFPTDAWLGTGLDLGLMRKVLEVVATEMYLPNHNIIPSDSLTLLLVPDYDDFPLDYVAFGIRDAFRIHVTGEELYALVERSGNAEDLVRDVAGRCRMIVGET